MLFRCAGLISATLVLALFYLPAWAAERQDETADDGAQPSAEVEAILSGSADAETYGETPRCIQVRRIRSSTVIDERHVAFQVGGGSYYLVQFRSRCPQLERRSTISYETRSGQLCALDSVRAVMSYGGTIRTGPPCQIPGFQEVTREQLQAISEELKQRRRQPELVEPEEPAADDPD